MQVDPIKAPLKAPVTTRLKLKDDMLLSDLAFNFKLRRYIMLIRIVLQTDMAFHGELTDKFLDNAEQHKGLPIKDWDDPVVALEFILHVAGAYTRPPFGST